MSRVESTDTAVAANSTGRANPVTSPSLSRTSQLSLVSEPHTRRQLLNSLDQHWPQTGDESVSVKPASMSSPNGSSPPVSQWASLYPVNLPSQSPPAPASTVANSNNGVSSSVRTVVTAAASPEKGTHRPIANGTNANGLGVSVQLSSPSIQPPTASATPFALTSATATPATITTPAPAAAAVAPSTAPATPVSPTIVLPQPGFVPSPSDTAASTNGNRPPSPTTASRIKTTTTTARLQTSQSAATAPASTSSPDVIQVPPLPPYEPDSKFDSSHITGLPSTQHTRRPSPIPPFNFNLAPVTTTNTAATTPSRSPNRSTQPSPDLLGSNATANSNVALSQKTTSSSPPAVSSTVSLAGVNPSFHHKKVDISFSSPQMHFSWLHEPESEVFNVDEEEEEVALHRRDEEKQKLVGTQTTSSDKLPHQSAAARLASKIRSGIVTKQHAQNALLHGGIYVYNVQEKLAAESLVSNKDHTEIKHLCSVYSTKFLGTRPVEIDAKSFAELRAHAAGGDRKILLAAAAAGGGNATPGATPIAPMQIESNASKAWDDLRKQLAAQRAERRRQEEEEAAKGNCCTVFWRMLC